MKIAFTIGKCKCLLLLMLAIVPSSCTLLDKDNSELSELNSSDHNKFISGIIKNNKYHAMDSTFSISIPYNKGTAEYAAMDIGEFYHESGSNVTFGPFGYDKSIYNVDLFKLNNVIYKKNWFEETSLKLINKYHTNLQRINTGSENIEKTELKINGKNTIHWSFLKKSNKHPFGYTRNHIFSIQFTDYIAIIVVEKLAEEPEDDYYSIAYDFANSLLLINNKQGQNLISSNP